MWLDTFYRPAVGLLTARLLVLEFIPTWLLYLMAALFIFYVYSTWPYWEFRAAGIPGPTPWPVFGTLWNIYMKGVRQADLDHIRRFGPIVGTYEGRTPALLVSDTEMLKQIMIKDFQSFSNRRPGGLNEYPIRMALPRLVDQHWKHVRCRVTPFFSSAKLKNILGRIGECADRFVENLRHDLQGRRYVEIKSYCGAFAMDTIASTAFGLHLDTKNEYNNPFVRAAEKIFNFTVQTPIIIILLLFPGCVRLLKKCGVEFFPRDASDFFVSVTNNALEERCKSGYDHSDFLQMMINAHVASPNDHSQSGYVQEPDGTWTKQGLTHEEVLAQSLIFFLAGYETTATSLALTCYCLATNPVHQELAAREVRSICNGQRWPSSEQLSEMKHLEMCIYETLRIYPPASRVNRICNRDTYLGPYRIRRGTIAVIPIHAIHHNPHIWPEPSCFIPERFLPKKRAEHSLNYMPFGAGPRQCVGMRFALLELKIALAQLLRKFVIKTCPETQIPLKFSNRMILQTEQGIVLRLEPRTWESSSPQQDDC